MKRVEAKDAYISKSPLSQAICHAGWVYCSGQVPVDPSTGEVPGTVEAQTRQVLSNIGAVLSAAGSSYSQVVKTTVFLTDIADAGAVNDAYHRYFPGVLPSRTMVAVAALANSAWKVEIEAIAFVARGRVAP